MAWFNYQKHGEIWGLIVVFASFIKSLFNNFKTRHFEFVNVQHYIWKTNFQNGAFLQLQPTLKNNLFLKKNIKMTTVVAYFVTVCLTYNTIVYIHEVLRPNAQRNKKSCLYSVFAAQLFLRHSSCLHVIKSFECCWPRKHCGPTNLCVSSWLLQIVQIFLSSIVVPCSSLPSDELTYID